MRAAASPGGGRARASLPVKMLLSAWARNGQQWPPQPVAAWPTWSHPFRCTVPNPLGTARPPPAVAAGPAASWRGGRCHVSPAAPAATAEGVLFVNVFDMWSFLAILLAKGSFWTKNLLQCTTTFANPRCVRESWVQFPFCFRPRIYLS